MRCPKCKGSVPQKLSVITCPACGAPVRRIPITPDLRFAVIVMAERNGWMFWGLLMIPFWMTLAMFEYVIGSGAMGRLFNGHWVVWWAHIFFSGLLMDLLMKTNGIMMRISQKETLKRAPWQLRKFRLGTNIAVLSALVVSQLVMGIQHWPSTPYIFTLTGILFIGTWWSFYPFLISLDDFEDRRSRAFFYEFGCDDLLKWRKMAVWVLGVFVFTGMIAAYMIAKPGAYQWLTHSEFIQFITSRAKVMFEWVPNFFK